MTDTIAHYERTAREYAAEITATPPPARAEALDRLLARVPAGARVLEVGSGTGRDADYLETRGVHVRRTDAAPAFVALQAERGKHAEQLDLRSDELGGPYDAVLALCVLIHVERARTAAVLRRIAGATRGPVLISVREGDGERAGDCHMTYWSRDAFAARLERAGLRVEWEQRHVDSADETWLTFLSPARL